MVLRPSSARTCSVRGALSLDSPCAPTASSPALVAGTHWGLALWIELTPKRCSCLPISSQLLYLAPSGPVSANAAEKMVNQQAGSCRYGLQPRPEGQSGQDGGAQGWHRAHRDRVAVEWAAWRHAVRSSTQKQSFALCSRARFAVHLAGLAPALRARPPSCHHAACSQSPPASDSASSPWENRGLDCSRARAASQPFLSIPVSPRALLHKPPSWHGNSTGDILLETQEGKLYWIKGPSAPDFFLFFFF